MPILKIRSKQRYDTEANWSSKNPVLLSGELAISSDKNGRYKVGDGTKRWSALEYAGYKIGSNITDTNGTLSITKTNVTNALGYTPPTKDTTYPVATQSENGLMPSTDKKKLDGIASGAEVNQNAFGKVVIGDTAIEADSKIDTLTLVAGSNVTLSPDDATDGITISSKDTIYTHPTYTSKISGLYKITVDGTGHVSAATVVAKSDITALGIPGSDTDTHYTSKNVVGSSTATSNTTTALTNGNVYLNSVENGAVTSTHKISGSGATTVTTDTSGNIVISSTDNNTIYDAATSSTLGLVKSGTDITVDSSGNVSVKDNSHNHTVSNISDLTATAAELNVLDGITASTAELNYVDGVTSNIQTQLNAKAPLASPTLTGTPKAPTASAGTNTTQIATTAFVQTAVSNGLAASDAMIIKGTIGTDGTVTALPTTYKTGWTYRVITAGTYAGQVCEIGDLIIALVDRSGSGNANTDWCVAQTNINGAITGVKGDNTYLSASQSGSVVTLSHKDVTRSNSTSTASPSHGGTFTAVKSVSSDSKGHITGVDTETVTLPTYSAATQSANGLMSSTDKKKIDGIATGAEVNQNAFSNVVIGNTTVSADTKTDSLTLVAGSNVTLTADATNDKITIASKDTVYSHPTYTSKSSGLYKITVDGTGHVSAATAVAKSDITALGIPGSDTTYGVATSSALGLVKSGTDITVDSSGNVSVNDDSHNHVISNIDGLQSALDGKSATGHTHDDRYYTESEIDSKLSGKANSSHGTHVPSTCTTITDWNSATTTGWYMGSNASNAPSTAWYFGYVIAHNTNYVVQEIYQFTASTDAKAIPKYIRAKMNGTWGSWTDVTVQKKVPSNAVFTDTDTWRPLGTTADTACAGNDSRLSNARPASDVYSWAKASSKPSYTASEVGAISTSENTTLNATIVLGKNDEYGMYPNTNNYCQLGRANLKFYKIFATNGYYDKINDATPITSANIGSQSVNYATSAESATSSTKATQDSAGQQINTTYIKALSVSGRTITYTKGDGSTGTITTQGTVIAASAPSGQAVGDFWIKTVTS